jgi:hypothetical protein
MKPPRSGLDGSSFLNHLLEMTAHISISRRLCRLFKDYLFYLLKIMIFESYQIKKYNYFLS